MKKSHMPSVVVRVVALFMGIVFIYSSCSGYLLPINPQSHNPAIEKQEQIVNQIRALNTEELRNSLNNLKAENPEIIFNEANEQRLDLFLNDPKMALELIVQEENGDVLLKLIDVMFNEGTIDEAVQALEILEPEIAKEFVGFLDEIAEALNMENEPVSITEARTVSSRPNIRNLPITLSKQTVQMPSRSVLFYSDDLTWDIVAWYAGFCVATVLGAYASTSLIPWVMIPGIVALVAGGASMLCQMISWQDGSDLGKFGKILADCIQNGNAEGLYERVKILLEESSETPMIITVGALTVATGVACYFSPLGKIVVAGVESVYIKIINFLQSILPKGIHWNIQGIIFDTSVNVPPPEIPPAPVPIPSVPSKPSKPKPVWWNPFTWF